MSHNIVIHLAEQIYESNWFRWKYDWMGRDRWQEPFMGRLQNALLTVLHCMQKIPWCKGHQSGRSEQEWCRHHPILGCNDRAIGWGAGRCHQTTTTTHCTQTVLAELIQTQQKKIDKLLETSSKIVAALQSQTGTSRKQAPNTNKRLQVCKHCKKLMAHKDN